MNWKKINLFAGVALWTAILQPVLRSSESRPVPLQTVESLMSAVQVAEKGLEQKKIEIKGKYIEQYLKPTLVTCSGDFVFEVNPLIPDDYVFSVDNRITGAANGKSFKDSVSFSQYNNTFVWYEKGVYPGSPPGLFQKTNVLAISDVQNSRRAGHLNASAFNATIFCTLLANRYTFRELFQLYKTGQFPGKLNLTNVGTDIVLNIETNEENGDVLEQLITLKAAPSLSLVSNVLSLKKTKGAVPFYETKMTVKGASLIAGSDLIFPSEVVREVFINNEKFSAITIEITDTKILPIGNWSSMVKPMIGSRVRDERNGTQYRVGEDWDQLRSLLFSK